jgi:hypothetical protein
VIWSPYSIFVVDGATGSPVWSVRSGHDRSSNYDTTDDVGRTWPGIAVADIDGDGTTEVVIAHGEGWVGVYDETGAFKPGWPKQPFTDEIRSLAVDDMDGDGSMEIVMARASGGSYDQWTVLEPNGTTRAGWPRLQSGQPGYGWGAYNQNIGVADLDNDGHAEVIFGTWPRNGGRRIGKIVVADWQGHLLQQIALPAHFKHKSAPRSATTRTQIPHTKSNAIYNLQSATRPGIPRGSARGRGTAAS